MANVATDAADKVVDAVVNVNVGSVEPHVMCATCCSTTTVSFNYPDCIGVSMEGIIFGCIATRVDACKPLTGNSNQLCVFANEQVMCVKPGKNLCKTKGQYAVLEPSNRRRARARVERQLLGASCLCLSGSGASKSSARCHATPRRPLRAPSASSSSGVTPSSPPTSSPRSSCCRRHRASTWARPRCLRSRADQLARRLLPALSFDSRPP